MRKALQEREVLLRSAPHIMWPLRFVMPHDPSHAAGLDDPRSACSCTTTWRGARCCRARDGVDLRRHAAGAPLQAARSRAASSTPTAGSTTRGWWCSTRSTPRERGATVLTRTALRRRAQRSAARLDRDAARRRRRRTRSVRARALVNAAGPWAAQFLRDVARRPPARRWRRSLRLVKGSHIVVPRLFDHDHAYIFQNPDKRIIFAIPYEGDFTLIGTTDVELRRRPGEARIDADEIAYLCEQASRYFSAADRPGRRGLELLRRAPAARRRRRATPSAVTRDYLLELDTAAAPLLSVWGGKITTFRKLAEEAADELRPHAAASQRPRLDRAAPACPAATCRPGSARPRRPDTDFERFVQR